MTNIGSWLPLVLLAVAFACMALVSWGMCHPEDMDD